MSTNAAPPKRRHLASGRADPASLAKHWELVEQGIACNIPPPEQLSATDKSMYDLLERASSDLDALQARHVVRDDDDKIRFPFSSSRKRMSTICQNATG